MNTSSDILFRKVPLLWPFKKDLTHSICQVWKELASGLFLLRFRILFKALEMHFIYLETDSLDSHLFLRETGDTPVPEVPLPARDIQPPAVLCAERGRSFATTVSKRTSSAILWERSGPPQQPWLSVFEERHYKEMSGCSQVSCFLPSPAMLIIILVSRKLITQIN